MINKRVKEGIRKIKKPSKNLKFGLGTIALVLGCLILLVISTFTQIKLNHSIPNLGVFSNLNFEYIPQIPAVLFIAALIGKKWGFLTVLLYIILGLTPWYPIFGLGGGLSYIFQYNFGYIFAFLFAVYFSASELQKKGIVVHLFLAALYGVFIVHVIGIIYMVVIALLRHDDWSFISDLIYYQSLSKFLYDIIFSLLAVIIGKICRKFLWIISI